MTIRRQHLLASTLLTAVALTAAPALAQPTTAPAASDEQSTQVGEVVVTGSRIRNNEFNSANPIQVLTSQRAQSAGLGDTVQFLQNSTIAAGSPQVNSIMSTAFVTNGGPGISSDVLALNMWVTTFQQHLVSAGAGLGVIIFLMASIIVIPYTIYAFRKWFE